MDHHSRQYSWRGYVSVFLFLSAITTTVSAVTHYAVPEEMEEGSVVANLATDLGLDVQTLTKRKMRVDAVGNKKYLDINKETGELFILERLDREFLCPLKTAEPCFLKLDATIENPIRMFNIEVEITDINDNAPHFRRGTMHVDISESSPIGERFSLNNAADPDVGTNSLSTVETAVKAYSDMTEVPLEYDIFSDLNLYLVIGLGSVSFLLLITILVTIVLKCQKPKPSKAAPPCRNSVISERNSTIADSTLVSNDAYWYSLFLAETRKGKMVVRQPVPKGSRYIVSSLPRGTGLTDTSGSAASTLQIANPADSSVVLKRRSEKKTHTRQINAEISFGWKFYEKVCDRNHYNNVQYHWRSTLY
ncbi:hypothetical protein F2P81_007596 [Scophthalmus maximus]|uniref:Cadherin domain-containing protein n=1 Tax=Scophthalmus maximus TaxID=52904 RepID=A0A6A4T8G8_SCOMX|nr:hypothetical protein F2P81_007596 [Scophthalmus maximus]